MYANTIGIAGDTLFHSHGALGDVSHSSSFPMQLQLTYENPKNSPAGRITNIPVAILTGRSLAF